MVDAVCPEYDDITFAALPVGASKTV